MKVQKLEPMAVNLSDFQDFCERLESALDDPPADNKFNKTPRQDKKKKFCQNNNNNKNKKHYCIMHRHNIIHSTKQCCTLKIVEAEKHKKVTKMATAKTRSAFIILARRFTLFQNFPKSKWQKNTNMLTEN